MEFGNLLQYGLPGALVTVLAGPAYALIKRGFRLSITAEIPGRPRT